MHRMGAGEREGVDQRGGRGGQQGRARRALPRFRLTGQDDPRMGCRRRGVPLHPHWARQLGAMHRLPSWWQFYRQCVRR